MASDRPGHPHPEHPHPELAEATLTELAADLASGAISSVELVAAHLDRIEAIDRGLGLGSIIAVNPEAMAAAEALDAERAAGAIRGPLHGIPIALKDNIDTDPGLDGDLTTTAGSLALADSRPGGDATVTARLRAAGAIIVAKTNLSEWANFRSTTSSSGWSGIGGLCRNPYVLDRSACGSSSGSGAAVAAGLVPAALGTETNGSIVCPSALNGLVGVKPTVGLTSRAGVVPIAHSQDTIGPMTRTVADAALVLAALVGPDERDPDTAASAGHTNAEYTTFVDPDGLRGARLGVARQLIGPNRHVAAVFDAVLDRLPELGVEIVDPVELPGHDELQETRPQRTVMLCEFKDDLAAYLATRTGGPRTLADIIRFNLDHDDDELAWLGQELLEMAEATGGLADPDYPAALAAARRLGRADGLDAVLDGPGRDGAGPDGRGPLDAVIAPTAVPAWPIDLLNGDPGSGGSSTTAAVAGYPLVTVPMGQVAGLPVGITFMGRAWSEPTLLRLAAGFEAAFAARRTPTYRPTLGPGLDQG